MNISICEIDGEVDGNRFKTWCDEIDRIANEKRNYTDKQITVVTGREHWLDYFNYGMTPEEALDEEESNEHWSLFGINNIIL